MQEMALIELIFGIIAGFGIFYFGMKLLSQSLQALFGSLVHALVNRISRNKLVVFFIGFMLTVVVQSSTATTVMVVGYVNAGLLTIQQSIFLILGANLGTTVTAWFVSLHFHEISYYAIALGFFLMLSFQFEKGKNFARSFFALGLLYLGMEFMVKSFSYLSFYPEVESIVLNLSDLNPINLFILLCCGCILTLFLPSSSSAVAITMAMGTAGVLDLSMALALLLGENLGTTITAWHSGIQLSTQARRVARLHTIMNVVGVSIVAIFFHPFVYFIDWLVPYEADSININFHIAAAHSIFNFFLSAFWLPLSAYLEKFICYWIPEKKHKEVQKLKYPKGAEWESSILAVELSLQEVKKLSAMVMSMLSRASDLLTGEEDLSSRKKILKYEKITDSIYKEMFAFSQELIQQSLSEKESRRVQVYLQMANELESIADTCAEVVKIRQRYETEKYDFQAEVELKTYFDQVSQFYEYNMIMLQEESFRYSANLKELSQVLQQNYHDLKHRFKKRAFQTESHLPSSILNIELLEVSNRTRKHCNNLFKSYLILEKV